MNLIINLNEILGGKFRFYLKEEYRISIFNQLKTKFKDWRVIAGILNLNPRHLFGLRRGWEYREGKKKLFYLSSEILTKILELARIEPEEAQKNIEIIKTGQSGNREPVQLPFKVNLDNESLFSIKRALGEYIFIKYFKSIINLNNLDKKLIIENDYVVLKIESDLKKEFPKKIVFDEIFAKEFGKWIGDRCGGDRRVEVSNKEYKFIEDFKNFLEKRLNQKDVKIILTHKPGIILPENLKNKANKIECCKTQYSDYSYRVGLPQRELRQLVFGFFEDNLFNILYNSKSSVRYAFYAGLFEAEGSVIKNSNNLAISYGFNLNKTKTNDKILNLVKKVVNLCYLLELDGFRPRISRKISKKSNTLKYDIILLNSHKNREQEVRFIKRTIYSFLTHPNKIKSINELEERLPRKKIVKENVKEAFLEKPLVKTEERKSLQPEVNIGLVGHY